MLFNLINLVQKNRLKPLITVEEGSANLIFGTFFAENCMKMKEIKPVGRGGLL